MVPPVHPPAVPAQGNLTILHGPMPNVAGAAWCRAFYTFTSSYTTGGEAPAFQTPRYITAAVFAKQAGGYGIVWNPGPPSRLLAYNLDGSGNLTTEVTAGTNLSSVTVPIIVYLIAH